MKYYFLLFTISYYLLTILKCFNPSSLLSFTLGSHCLCCLLEMSVDLSSVDEDSRLLEGGTEPVYYCDLCPKSFKQFSALNKHKRIFHIITSFTCEHCSKTFLRRRTLSRHLRKYCRPDNKRKLHQCNECPQNFYTKADLKKHRKVHQPRELLQCKICYKSYKRVFDFNVHRNSDCLKSDPNAMKRIAYVKDFFDLRLASSDDVTPKYGLLDSELDYCHLSMAFPSSQTDSQEVTITVTTSMFH